MATIDEMKEDIYYWKEELMTSTVMEDPIQIEKDLDGLIYTTNKLIDYLKTRPEE